MGHERWGWALVAVGAVVVTLSALADPIGLGDGDGIGWKQSIGMLVGLGALAVGVMYARRGHRGSPPVEI
jgi:hypothetical protein